MILFVSAELKFNWDKLVEMYGETERRRVRIEERRVGRAIK